MKNNVSNSEAIPTTVLANWPTRSSTPCQCHQIHRIVIIGGGVAGLSAAIWLRRFGFAPLLIEQGHQVGGILRALGNVIPDYPGVPQITGNRLANRLERHARAVRADMRCKLNVEAIIPERTMLETSQGSLCYDALVIATGSRDRRLDVPGETAMHTRGETPIADLDAARYAGQMVVVVGGGDRALEEALILADAGVLVTLVHRTDHFRAQQHFVDRARGHALISIESNSTVVAIRGDDRVRGVEVASRGHCRRIDCVAALVRIGVVGNAEFSEGAVARDANGFILTDSGCRTTAPRIWAIGDVTAPAQIQSISTAVGHAAIVAKQISLASTALESQITA